MLANKYDPYCCDMAAPGHFIMLLLLRALLRPKKPRPPAAASLAILGSDC